MASKDPELWKSSAGPIPVKSPVSEQLPDEIIEEILLLTSPDAFASLIILNRKWRAVSQQSHLYAHHLSRCPSYSAAHHGTTLPDDEESLPRLRRLFSQEIKRNLFEAYLRPKETVISLVSTSISSSSAPGGEAFHFSLSPKGHYVLAYSSSRIHVIDVTGPEVLVKRELKILRRPASTTITDDGSLLAVLSTDLQVDLYDLTGDHPKHTHAVALDHTPRTIALSPTGVVLAAAYDSGVEVSSLDPTCSNIERRAVKCYAVDSLCFSKDGTQLLGTTMQSRNPSTVILTAPYYNTGGTVPEEGVSVSALWTTSILFPNGSRDCSHAVLLPSASDEEASWAFTYDRVFETFRAVRIDDLRNGTTYFTGPIADTSSISKLLPSTLPASSQRGDLVASGFQGAIWLYGVPEDLDALPNVSNMVHSNTDSGGSTPSTHLGRRNSAPSLRSVHRHRDTLSRTPQWQLLCDRFRNTFVEGRKITTLDQVSTMSWVSNNNASPHGERLVAVAPGVSGKVPPGESWEDDGMSPVDGGRISILDFNYAICDGRKTTVTIEVGANQPEVLEEEHRDLDTEVAIVRRRTVAQRRGNRSHVSRSSTIVPHVPEPPPAPVVEDDLGDPFAALPAIPSRFSSQATTSEQSDDVSLEEVQEAFDAPYSHTSPRSGTTLRRAATAAAVNRRLHPRAVAQEHIEYRRADGREEHPHESDADNWVPPPPPYSKDPLPPLPEHIQRSLIAEAAQSTSQRSNTHRSPTFDFASLSPDGLTRSRTVASSSTGRSRRESFPFQRSVSDFTTSMNVDSVSIDEDRPRPASSPSFPDFDDLYDVSPPGTPPLAPQTMPISQISPINQIPRRPIGSTASTNTSPTPDIRATWLGPASPVPTPQGSVSPYEPVQNSREREVATERPTTMTTATRIENKEVPPRPTEDHHMIQLPSPIPIPQGPQEFMAPRSVIPTTPPRDSEQKMESVSPLSTRTKTAPVTRSSRQLADDLTPISKRSETAPMPLARAENASHPRGMVPPSPDQLARLNSRQGRPAGLTDPSRRLSGSHQPHRSSSGHGPASSWEGSQQNQQQPQQSPPRMASGSPYRNTPPRAAVGAYNSPNSRNSIHGVPSRYLQSGSPQQNGSPNRRVSLQPPNRIQSPSNLRPPMARLETINSITSQGEPSPFLPAKPMAVGISRNPSRAERGAAKNIQDAKKKGWRQSMYGPKKEKKSKKDKYGDTASSSGWTDVTHGSRKEDMERKSSKCIVM
ncbi:hypothetical protein BJ875DRAFT_494745 [Amylocarpus encephaloides]|uniref:F-box domain-containing protein n=1 Tax=Amylocarpus encephaloides TaxID=45428 RepID=A0A9P7YLL0_9HELO|nr:hypothetical protein BJ875DRAFT_494745 [Amylocarpus encephaloides]